MVAIELVDHASRSFAARVAISPIFPGVVADLEVANTVVERSMTYSTGKSFAILVFPLTIALGAPATNSVLERRC